MKKKVLMGFMVATMMLSATYQKSAAPLGLQELSESV